MKWYDSDYYRLPHIPFVIALPDLCFKVHLPLSRAAENVYRQYFDLIQIDQGVKTKAIGYKALGFAAFCSKFVITGKGYELVWEPEGWHNERELAIDDRRLSLDTRPALGFEAFSIYSNYCRLNRERKKQQAISDLDDNQVKPEYLKEMLPSLIKTKELELKDFNKAVTEHIFRGEPIKKTARVTGSKI
ncbi:MAG: hypothetical protein WAW61_21745 [Methylococcaceae bacterium]